MERVARKTQKATKASPKVQKEITEIVKHCPNKSGEGNPVSAPILRGSTTNDTRNMDSNSATSTNTIVQATDGAINPSATISADKGATNPTTIVSAANSTTSSTIVISSTPSESNRTTDSNPDSENMDDTLGHKSISEQRTIQNIQYTSLQHQVQNITIASLNIENFQSNKLFLKTLMENSDIIAIQEHWFFCFRKRPSHRILQSKQF